MLDMAPLVRFWTRLLAWGGVSTVVDIVCSAAWDGFSLWLLFLADGAYVTITCAFSFVVCTVECRYQGDNCEVKTEANLGMHAAVNIETLNTN